MESLIDFPAALAMLKGGSKIYRKGWNGPNQFISLQVPDAHSKMTLPYAYITTTSGDRVAWVPSQGDLFAEDWLVIQAE